MIRFVKGFIALWSATLYCTAPVLADIVALQTAIVEVNGAKYFGTYSKDPLSSNNWGKDLPLEENPVQGMLIALKDDPYGCTESAFKNITSLNVQEGFIALVRRGNCKFTDKALVAQHAGAIGVIIYDTVEAVYNTTVGENSTKPTRMMAFDCSSGQSTLPSLASPPWSSANNSPECSESAKCSSKQCIPSGDGNEVCCMWDVADYMGGESNERIVIPAVRITVKDAATILKIDVSRTTVALYKRYVPRVDAAQVLIWLLAIATIIVSGYVASSLERRKSLVKSKGCTQVVREQLIIAQQDEPAMDLTIYHAIGFLVFGSAVLLLLFYANIVMVVIVLFCIGACSAINNVVFSNIFSPVKCLRDFKLYELISEYWGDIRINLADVLGFFTSLALVLWWAFYRHSNYAWILQDFFGVCVCIVFLQVIRLPNIKIATVLLILVFLYDIFFVFISPYIFKESVMIKAAQGGNQGESTAPTGFCIRYPDNSEFKCLREDLPILLRMPKVSNWLGGYAMLGLGDIVLPGLLVAFCARYDYATRGNLVGPTSEKFNTPVVKNLSGRCGLFCIMCIGYSVGLFLANLGVILMRQGQPALLYLVPCTLGILVIVAWRGGFLKKLWTGPREEFQNIPAETIDGNYDEAIGAGNTIASREIVVGVEASVNTPDQEENTNAPFVLEKNTQRSVV